MTGNHRKHRQSQQRLAVSQFVDFPSPDEIYAAYFLGIQLT